MIKELKYLFFMMVIFFFLFFTLRYYFSSENHIKNNRSLNQLDKNIKNIEKDLILLKNNTANIIENVEYNKDKKNKKYSFWDLLYLDND